MTRRKKEYSPEENTTFNTTNNYNIELEFNLINHDKELSDAEDAIETLKLKVIEIIINETLDDNVHEEFYEEIMRVLDYTGRLSMQIFAINDLLEEQYLKKYKNAPAMAKELWLNHYEQLHQPYNKIKNRCFKLLDRLDNGYVALYDKNPPNWNP